MPNDMESLDAMLNESTNPAQAAPAVPAVSAVSAAPVAPAVTEPATPATDPSTTIPATAPAAADGLAPAADPATAAPAAEAPDNDPESVFNNKNKQNAAFAQQRIENKQLKDTILKLAKTLGIEDTSDVNKTVGALNQRLLEYDAQKSNIPLPVLQEIETSNARQQELELALRKQDATIGFATVQSKYKLSPEQVKEFAEQVLDAGKNPFAEPVDLVKEYQMLNFDKILEQTRNEERQATLARQTKAAEHSSTPASHVGAASPAVGAVTSIGDLNRMLDELSRK